MVTGRPTARLFATLTVALALCVGLAACSNPEDAMTPQEARDILVATITETAALVEGPDWAETSVPAPQECAVGGAAGTKYGHDMAAPRPDRDRLADVEKVAAYWESLGMNVRILPERPVVYGSGGPIQNISFSTDPGNYLIGGTSLCAPGKPAEDTE